MLPIYFHTTVDDTIHWPRQNYETDHVANLCSFNCGCGREWDVNEKGEKELHNVANCGWHDYTGDVICSDYNKSPNHNLNRIHSYQELAIKSACRCQPSITLIKHAEAESSRTHADNLNYHLLKQEHYTYPWRNVDCEDFCTTCCIIVLYNMNEDTLDKWCEKLIRLQEKGEWSCV